MTHKERDLLTETVFNELRTTEDRANFLLLIQSYKDELTELIFERQNLIHQIINEDTNLK